MGFRPWLVDIMLMNDMDETAVGKHIYVLASCWHGATYWSGALPLAAERHPLRPFSPPFPLVFQCSHRCHESHDLSRGCWCGQGANLTGSLSPIPRSDAKLSDTK